MWERTADMTTMGHYLPAAIALEEMISALQQSQVMARSPELPHVWKCAEEQSSAFSGLIRRNTAYPLSAFHVHEKV